MKKISFRNLSEKTRKFLNELVVEYSIQDAAGIKLLEVAGGALDRLIEAQDILKKEGLTINDRHGNPKLHPLNIVEKDARAHFLMAMKALNLDLEPLKQIGRPVGR